MNKGSWQRIGLAVAELALVTTLVFSVATAFDHLHRYLELFSHFRLQYFAASLALLLIFLWLKWHIYVWLAVAIVLLNAWFVVPWYLPTDWRDAGQEAVPSSQGEPLRLMAANLQIGNGHKDRLIAAVEKLQPDILVVQELTSDWLIELAAINPAYPYRIAEPREDPFGVGLYSKFPLEGTAVIASVPLGTPDVVATALVGGQRLSIIATHPINPIGAVNYGARNLHLDSIATLAATTPGPLVVIGDLNTSMWGSHYRQFEQKSGLVNARRGHGIAPTWPTWLFPAMIPIDHCVVSPSIEVIDFRAGPGTGSDHHPIVVDLRLPD